MDVQLKERYKRWCRFFRDNPEEFVAQVLGIDLLPYQRYVVHNMLLSNSSFFLAARGSAKSFLTAVCAVAYALLYPNSKTVVSASVESQASLLVTSKIQGELCSLSPMLKYMQQLGLIEFGRTDAGAAKVDFLLNGSSIIGAAPINSSRGLRANMIILDEVRLLSSQAINSILLPMRTKRIPVYAAATQDGEQALVCSLTSSGFSYEPWVNTFKQHFVRAAAPSQRQRLKYFVMAFDIYACIQQGVKSLEDLEALKQNTDALNFQIELENVIAGNILDGYFSADLFLPAQTMLTGLSRRIEGEARVICADLAFQSNANGANDKTIIICASVNTTTGFKRLDYMQEWEASDSEGFLIRIHQLYEQYDPMIIGFDSRSGGRIIGAQLMSNVGNYQAFGLAPAEYQRISSATLDDYNAYATDPYAPEVLVPIIGTAQNNSDNWISLMNSLRGGQWQLLKTAAKAEEYYMGTNQFYEWDSAKYAEEIAPYLQCDLMVQEAVNLKAERKNNLLHLKEPRNLTKDAIVCMQYTNDLLDRIYQFEKNSQVQCDGYLDNLDVFW